MILPLLIVFLVLVCAYLEYQKKINLHNKMFVGVICILTFTICFSFIKKYDKSYDNQEHDNQEHDNQELDNQEHDNQEPFENKPKEIFITSQPYPKNYKEKKEKFKSSKNKNPTLEELSNSELMNKLEQIQNQKKKKEKFIIPRLKKNRQPYNNFIYSQNQKEPFKETKDKKKKEKVKKKNTFFVKDEPKCFKKIIYDDYGPSKSQLEHFYNKPKEKGYSQIDNKFWRFPHKQPPPCITDRVKLPSSIILNGSGTNYLELDENGDIPYKEKDISQTNIGSILPKFEFKETYD